MTTTTLLFSSTTTIVVSILVLVSWFEVFVHGFCAAPDCAAAAKRRILGAAKFHQHLQKRCNRKGVHDNEHSYRWMMMIPDPNAVLTIPVLVGYPIPGQAPLLVAAAEQNTRVFANDTDAMARH
jgi:hypothetical protein